MIKKFEGFDKDDLNDDGYYLSKQIKDTKPYKKDQEEYKDEEINIDGLSNSEIALLIKQKTKLLKWEDLILKEDEIIDHEHDSRAYLTWTVPNNILKMLQALGSKHTEFNIQVDDYDIINRTHFAEGIPLILQGLGLGYKIYKATIKKLGFASTAKDASDEAQRMWSYLIKDPEFYSLVTHKNALVIDKSVEKSKVEKIIKEFVHYRVYRGFNGTDEYLKDMAMADILIKVDKDLAKDFKHVRFNKLNSDILKRYKQVSLSEEMKIDSQYPKAHIGQDIMLIKGSEKRKITGISLFGNSLIHYSATGGYDSLNRSDFYVISHNFTETKVNIGDMILHKNIEDWIIQDVYIITSNRYGIEINQEEIYMKDVRKVDLTPVNNHFDVVKGDVVARPYGVKYMAFKAIEVFPNYVIVSHRGEMIEIPMKDVSKVKIYQ